MSPLKVTNRLDVTFDDVFPLGDDRRRATLITPHRWKKKFTKKPGFTILDTYCALIPSRACVEVLNNVPRANGVQFGRENN